MEIIESNNDTRNEKSSAEVMMIKPPTRLQSQAPASLDLGLAATAFSVDDCGSCSGAIPLLSPLVLSPAMREESNQMSVDACGCDCGVHICGGKREEEEDDDDDDDDEEGNGETVNDSVRRLNVLWQYKGVSTCEDTSCMFSFFRSQCMIDAAQ